MRHSKKTQQKKLSKTKDPAMLPTLNANAAGIDTGSEEHWVAVPSNHDEQPVRSFRCFTSDLLAMAQWPKECRINKERVKKTKARQLEYAITLEPLTGGEVS